MSPKIDEILEMFPDATIIIDDETGEIIGIVIEVIADAASAKKAV